MTTELRASSQLPTRFGSFKLDVFTDADGNEHLALSAGKPVNNSLVRLHSECATGDIMGSLRCDCRNQLETALGRIAEAGEGLLIYLRGHEGRGIGLANKIKAYALQDEGLDTVEANVKLGFAPDQRNYAAAVDILKHYGMTEVQLLSNNRKKSEELEKAGIKVTQHVSIWTAINPHNENYLNTKQTKMGHLK